ncbi:MAG: sigma-70 family RNA polymerase sigma factor [Oscillospiraceae bacterium]|jgi:RNA polymerase sporulation-specific sigma factor|nr:sigma-70 family RNA polymerase sigma factor [Oscillospiraceae bacterium]
MNNIKNRFLLFIESFLKITHGGVYYINGAETLPPPLCETDERNAFEMLADPVRRRDGRDLLISHNLRLVVYIAKKFESNYAGLEDLISIGTVGLIKAVNTFSPEKNIKLATYASKCVENEILMFLRKASNRGNEISFEESLNTDCDGNELTLSDLLATDGEDIVDRLENKAKRETLRKVIDNLDIREREIMQKRFGLDGEKERTQKELAEEIGISQSYISRLEKKIIRKLRRDFEKLCFIG